MSDEPTPDPGGSASRSSSSMTVVCASANPGKVAEMRDLLGGLVDFRARPGHVGEIVEDADTLVGNARLKAAAIADATGLPAVADDTGLEVDALRGAPGVHTARYAGPDCTPADNRVKMLAELSDVPVGRRTATFRTVALLRWPDGAELVAEGMCRGSIAEAERGAGGFGYDAVFVPDDSDGRTFAEMRDDEKNAISHRGRAFRTLAELIVALPDA